MARLYVPDDVKADIIEAIQKSPELWDPDSSITNKKLKALSWDKVAKKVGIEVAKIKSHWRTLQRNYTDHIGGEKSMNPDLVRRMQFMHYILSDPNIKKTSVPRSSNQPKVSKGIGKKPPKAGKVTVEMGNTSAQFFADDHSSTFVINHGSGTSTPQRKPSNTPKKVTKPATATSKDIKVCSWIAGYLLKENSVMTGSLKFFKHDMIEILWCRNPRLVEELVSDPRAYQDLNVPKEVSDALRCHKP